MPIWLSPLLWSLAVPSVPTQLIPEVLATPARAVVSKPDGIAPGKHPFKGKPPANGWRVDPERTQLSFEVEGNVRGAFPGGLSGAVDPKVGRGVIELRLQTLHTEPPDAERDRKVVAALFERREDLEPALAAAIQTERKILNQAFTPGNARAVLEVKRIADTHHRPLDLSKVAKEGTKTWVFVWADLHLFDSAVVPLFFSLAAQREGDALVLRTDPPNDATVPLEEQFGTSLGASIVRVLEACGWTSALRDGTVPIATVRFEPLTLLPPEPAPSKKK